MVLFSKWYGKSSLYCNIVSWGGQEALQAYANAPNLPLSTIWSSRYFHKIRNVGNGEKFNSALVTHPWFKLLGVQMMRLQHIWIIMKLLLAATKQLSDWFSPSVCPSVRPSVCLSVTPFSPCSHYRIIMKFSGVITMVRSDVHAKGQGQRSKVKVTEVNTQLSRFRTLTPVWIDIWQWNHAHSWKQHRRGALLFFKVIRQISRSHGSKNRRIWPRLGVSGL